MPDNLQDGWNLIAYFSRKTTSSAIVSTYREFFHRWGIPDEIALDGASNLLSRELPDFLRRWSIHRRLSSAYYPQSNGRAEAAVNDAFNHGTLWCERYY